MKTLAEINSERRGIIAEGIERIVRKGSLRGRTYSAKELSELSDGIIPAENFEASFARGFNIADKAKARNSYRWLGNYYKLYELLQCEIIEEPHELTYKVYDEEGNLVDTFKKTKSVLKARFV